MGVSVQNSLTTNQRLSDVEKKLEETEARVEKLEVTGDSVSIAATEPEKPAEEAEEQMQETDITSLVEKKEKLQPRISRKRAQASGKQDKKSARSSAPEYEGFPSSFSHTTYAGKIRKMPAC